VARGILDQGLAGSPLMEPAPLAGFGARYDLRADRLTPSQFEVAVTADRRTATLSFTA
jgi:hypothetical protein